MQMKEEICYLATRFSFLLGAFLLAAVVPERSVAFYPLTFHNHIMPKQIFRRIETQDWMTCLLECHSDIECSSYNFKYNSETGINCELSKCAVREGATEKENGLLFEEGFVFQQIRPTKNKNLCTIRGKDKVPALSFGGLEESFILGFSNRYLTDLSNYLNDGMDTPRKWKRCYHAYEDQIDPPQFHRSCDSKGPTVTIIRDFKYIFGGYFDRSWKSSTQRCSWLKCEKAFLFSLNNPNNYGPHRFNIRTDGSKNAVYDCLNFGPTFGRGYDLVIYGNNTKYNSYSRSVSYNTPPGCEHQDMNSCKFYTGQSFFTVDEMEVFYENK